MTAATSTFQEPTGTVHPYAGSTPIPLDPIDIDTPLRACRLSFTYGDYSAASVGVSFKSSRGLAGG